MLSTQDALTRAGDALYNTMLRTLTSMVPATMYFMGFTTRHCSNQLGSDIKIANSVTCITTVPLLDALLDSNWN